MISPKPKVRVRYCLRDMIESNRSIRIIRLGGWINVSVTRLFFDLMVVKRLKTNATWLARTVSAMLTSIVPPICVNCHMLHSKPHRLCEDCLRSLRANLCPHWLRHRPRHGTQLLHRTPQLMSALPQAPAAIDHLQSLFLYNGVLPNMITRWKYEGALELTDIMAQWGSRYSHVPNTYDFVTTIPCHWRRRFLRGFDHTRSLATSLAARKVIMKPTQLLKHSRALPYQHLQDVRERRIDDDHFRTTWPLDGARVLIIDDVVTSGTTLSAAATALRAAGAIVVDAFTLANAQPGLHYCLRLERG